jgi:hypothetical protein
MCSVIITFLFVVLFVACIIVLVRIPLRTYKFFRYLTMSIFMILSFAGKIIFCCSLLQ